MKTGGLLEKRLEDCLTFFRKKFEHIFQSASDAYMESSVIVVNGFAFTLNLH